MTGRRPRGRRPGGEDTRRTIVDAARREFASAGYDGTSLRAVARAAGVDPSLVHHYFEDKAELFAQTLDIPLHPRALVASVLDGDPAGVGERLARAFFGVWDEPHGRERMQAVLRAATTNEAAARMLREFLLHEVVGRLAVALDGPDPELGAALAASQMVGLAMARYVVGVEPLVNADVETLVARVAPTLQRYLLGPA